ncbi:DUF4437 domain-containing protein [Alteromonas gracilis]|uniref:DUF4437 domain-containing protein n=1 Tax=Alteromonas gracilis TaxID=1479524 RepID=UPI0030D43881
MAVKKYTHSTFLGLIALSLASSSFSLHAATKIVTADEVNWGYLNPARGEKSPGAADLWGDRTKNTATRHAGAFQRRLFVSATYS